MISLTGVVTEPTLEADAIAPTGLSPMTTFFGVLIRESSGGPSFFRLNGRLPSGVLVAGSFQPANGYVRIWVTEKTLSLVAYGEHLRFADLRGGEGSAPADNSLPDDGGREAGGWLIRATRRPWLGELCPA
ncbi:hypothetical protein [Sabulicella rubraurantiaca]|uniref:hypothetical protein n=1 Tax=Sabulicella rubraurantiaca TaxID=2811429 RepID=UPI001A977B03|nr:hypothetical protein [Sabulicella rubraurantiaca]